MDDRETALRECKVVAVVGLSPDPSRPSYAVARYLQRHGYRIIPVNPKAKEILGERAYASLKDIPDEVDVVDVFRKSEEVPAIVEDALSIGARCVWMQEGVEHAASAERARDSGLRVVMDCCIMKEHARLLGEGRLGPAR